MSTLQQCRAETGADWSLWPHRALGSADTTIRYRTGTHRLISPDETWSAVRPHLQTAGITRVADVTWLDDLGIPTAQAIRPASLTLSVSQGKGTTLRAAQVSAVMESLEAWHSEQVIPDLAATSARELAAELTYDPADLPRPSGSLYHDRARLDWMRATTLLSGETTWVPWSSVLVNVSVGRRWAPPLFTMDTNGLASGNTYSEAALHGLYELMERHSVGTAVAGSTMFEVADDDLAASAAAELIHRITDTGSALSVARIDTWAGYFCFAAELTSPLLEVPFAGYGLHHDPNVALLRAVTEAAQSRLTAISGAREDLPAAIYDRFAKLHTYSPARRDMVTMPQAAEIPWRATISDSIPELVGAAAASVTAATGVEPVAAVCDFPGACVPVVRVLAPRLSTSTVSPMRTTLEGSTS